MQSTVSLNKKKIAPFANRSSDGLITRWLLEIKRFHANRGLAEERAARQRPRLEELILDACTVVRVSKKHTRTHTSAVSEWVSGERTSRNSLRRSEQMISPLMQGFGNVTNSPRQTCPISKHCISNYQHGHFTSRFTKSLAYLQRQAELCRCCLFETICWQQTFVIRRAKNRRWHACEGLTFLSRRLTEGKMKAKHRLQCGHWTRPAFGRGYWDTGVRVLQQLQGIGEKILIISGAGETILTEVSIHWLQPPTSILQM